MELDGAVGVEQQALGSGDDSHAKTVVVAWAGWQQRTRASAGSPAQSCQYPGWRNRGMALEPKSSVGQDAHWIRRATPEAPGCGDFGTSEQSAQTLVEAAAALVRERVEDGECGSVGMQVAEWVVVAEIEWPTVAEWMMMVESEAFAAVGRSERE